MLGGSDTFMKIVYLLFDTTKLKLLTGANYCVTDMRHVAIIIL